MLKKCIKSVLVKLKKKPVNKQQKTYYKRQPCYSWFENKNSQYN